jgi:hypothetical protein
VLEKTGKPLGFSKTVGVSPAATEPSRLDQTQRRMVQKVSMATFGRDGPVSGGTAELRMRSAAAAAPWPLGEILTGDGETQARDPAQPSELALTTLRLESSSQLRGRRNGR